MILVDPRDGPGKDHSITRRMLTYIRREGLAADSSNLLEAGDFAFDGWGPEGPCSIGVERKTIRDMLKSIDDGRFNEQRGKMTRWFQFSWLAIEGVWRVHTENGCIVEQYSDGGRMYWAHPTGRPTPYEKLYNYLVSCQMAGVFNTFSQDLHHTCINVCNLYRWYQKRWGDHKSMLQMRTLNVAPRIMTRNHRPSLVKRWAAEIDGIGEEKSSEAETVFKTARDLANGDELDWIRCPGVHPKLAINIIKQIRGGR